MLEPGWTATYYCNTSSIQPDTYCVVLVAKPAEGLLGTGIITQAARDEYALCVREPGSAGNCFAFPLSEPDADGFRQSIVACALRQPGRYDIGWSFEYTQEGGVTSLLYPGVLSLELTAPAPADYCEAHPPGQPAS
jgi:hypothetical protein